MSKNICLLLLFMVIIVTSESLAQQDTFSTHILHEIAAAQCRQDSFYFAGMFPSHRYYGTPKGKMKEDNNVFFTGLIAMTLGELQEDMSGEDRTLSNQIHDRACTCFPRFRHKSGRGTYNFWTTNPNIVFPNSKFLNLFKKWHSLPDDIDDTSILLLAMEADSTTAHHTRKLMEEHANTVNYTIRNTFKRYRHIPAYSTWFGKRMPIDFDACVLANTMYFISHYQMAGTRYDSATIDLLDAIIRNREYMDHPSYISPHYGAPPIIIYHFARLIGNSTIPKLMQDRTQLILDAKSLLAKATDDMDKVILSTSLLWLGASAPEINLSKVNTDGSFVFFKAGFNSLLPNVGKKMLSGFRLISYYYRCPAYNKVLLLQHYLVRQKVRRAALTYLNFL